MARYRKIIIIVITVIIAVFSALSAYLYFAEEPVIFTGESELEVISGNWPPPQMPLPPPKILSGTTIAIVKEIRAAANEILADVSLPKVADESGAVPAGDFQSREFILAVSDKTAIERLAPKQQKGLKLSDVKSGEKIQITYSGDILNSQTNKLTVSSVKIYQSAK